MLKRNPLDWLVIWLLKRRMRKHGYTNRVINTVISYYSRPKPRYYPDMFTGDKILEARRT